MTFIVLLFNMFGDKTEIGKFEDKLACECFVEAMHNHIQALNEKTPDLKSVHIVNEKGEDCWKKVMG
jgi:hypothetical protein